jgi:hypothetical protein
MSNQEILFPLKKAYQDFVGVILPLSNELFLSSMDGWAPRDVVAHLIGWNRLMIEASLSILAGQAPTYYADTTNDYSTINAGFTTKYSSHSKQELLSELKLSLESFEALILALPDEEMLADHGVRHYSGSPATVSKIIASLAGDYQSHTRQIKAWSNQKEVH